MPLGSQPSTHSAAGAPDEQLPKWIKMHLAVGRFIEGFSKFKTHSRVVALPFKKIAKFNVPANEIDSLEFVRANTTIPVPKVLNVYDKQPDGTAHIVMTRLPGTPLTWALRDMGPTQITATIRDLVHYLAQLRGLKPPRSEKGRPIVGGALGGPGFDHRLGPETWGPFSTVADFHTSARFGESLDQWDHEPAVIAIHEKPEGVYRVCFTHADLDPRNILVDPKDGKITGIVDWELGGWYPEYWEYTKMFYAWMRPQWEQWFAAISGEEGIEKYENERMAEKAIIWTRAGPFGYL